MDSEIYFKMEYCVLCGFQKTIDPVRLLNQMTKAREMVSEIQMAHQSNNASCKTRSQHAHNRTYVMLYYEVPCCYITLHTLSICNAQKATLSSRHMQTV